MSSYLVYRYSVTQPQAGLVLCPLMRRNNQMFWARMQFRTSVIPEVRSCKMLSEYITLSLSGQQEGAGETMGLWVGRRLQPVPVSQRSHAQVSTTMVFSSILNHTSLYINMITVFSSILSHTSLYINMIQYSPVYSAIQACTPIWYSILQYTQPYKLVHQYDNSILQYTQPYKPVHQYDTVFSSILSHTSLYTNMITVFSSILSHTRLYTNMIQYSSLSSLPFPAISQGCLSVRGEDEWRKKDTSFWGRNERQGQGEGQVEQRVAENQRSKCPKISPPCSVQLCTWLQHHTSPCNIYSI